MFRKLFAHIRIGFLQEFAYPISLVFFLILPLAFTAAVSAGLRGVMGGGSQEPRVYATYLYVVSHDESFLVDSLMDILSQNDLSPQLTESLPDDNFGLEIPQDFSQKLLAGEDVTVILHTLPTSSESQVVEQYVRAGISHLGGAVLVAEMGLEQAQEDGIVQGEDQEKAYFEEILRETLVNSAEPIAVSTVDWAGGVAVTQEQAGATSSEQASAGQIVTWTQITFLAAAEVFVAERDGGTLRRLLVSRSSRAITLTGKLLSRLLLGLLQMTVLFVGGALIFGVQWSQDSVALAAVSLAFAMATVGMGMFIATVVKTRGQANSVVIGLAMGLSALGGAWYPLEITPPLYRQIVKILPTDWAMRAFTDLLVRHAGLKDVLPAVGVLLGFAVVFLLLGLLRFKKLEQDRS